MDVTYNATRGDWTITTAEAITDEAAAAITFRATPEQVVLGQFVAVNDADGVRIGHVKHATYVERFNGPAYVTVGIHLR